MKRGEHRLEITGPERGPEEGDYVTTLLAARVVRLLPRGWAEVLDEDGATHEVPAHTLRPAHEPFRDRFARKREGAPAEAPAARRRAPRPADAPRLAPEHLGEPRGPPHRRDRRDDGRRRQHRKMQRRRKREGW